MSALAIHPSPNNILSLSAVNASPFPPKPLQLTQPKSHIRRDHAQHLHHLSQYLPPAEREFIRSILRSGRRVADLASLLHLSVPALRRRVATLSRRMLAPEFAFVAIRHQALAEPLASVARTCFLEGLSVRAAALRLNLSLHKVRTLRHQITAMTRGVHVLHTLAAKPPE